MRTRASLRSGLPEAGRRSFGPASAGSRLASVALGILLALPACGGPDLPEGATVRVRVPPGSGVRAIADSLESAGLIDHPRLFSMYVRLRGADEELKAGLYELTAGMGYGELLRALRSGAVVSLPLTIPEGLTLAEVAALIAGFTEDSSEAVLRLLRDSARAAALGVPGPTLEGYLFPETYHFSEDTGPAAIVETMVGRYREFWGDEERRLADSLELDEREVVTLASIVEEEARIGEERAVIAGVYLNRLRIGMPLQADPTVQYALGERRERLLFRDIDAVADHPYNTYTHPGLPPGPIASPGAASLDATLRPARHDYLFFVARPDGSHEFTRTIREHNNARLRIRREAARPEPDTGGAEGRSDAGRAEGRSDAGVTKGRPDAAVTTGRSDAGVTKGRPDAGGAEHPSGADGGADTTP